MKSGLPIDAVLPEIKSALSERNTAVLQAPPGAGKTTIVPLALLDEPWLAGRKILMLEPRRLATRSAARRMASLLKESAGGTVGFRVRLETKVSSATKIEVVTEGILTRMLQSDPTLDDVGLVIFDEYHERSLHADLGLAFVRQTQSLLRDDLRILVMSATLDGTRVAKLLDDAPIVTSAGRQFPVKSVYLDRKPDTDRYFRIEKTVASAIYRALNENEGSLLVFLPGVGEIKRVQSALEESDLPNDVDIAPLYGQLTRKDQDFAIQPANSRRRKIVLATSIAESSLTIEGITVVIDAGLMRVPKFDPSNGMTRLETVRVSRASADQRQGRAGRLSPGVCYRLWTKSDDAMLHDFSQPEILAADLAPLALELAQWGINDPEELDWLDVPPAATLSQGRELLIQLSALNINHKLTDHGRKMARIPSHPRLAHMLIVADKLKKTATACLMAALLNERDILIAPRDFLQADLQLRLEAIVKNKPTILGMKVRRPAVKRIQQEARSLQSKLGQSKFGRSNTKIDPTDAGLLLALAYPDRIARNRKTKPQNGSEGKFLLRNGRSAHLPKHDSLVKSTFLATAWSDGRRNEAKIFLAGEISESELKTHFDDQIEWQDEVNWNDQLNAVEAHSIQRLGALVLDRKVIKNPDASLIGKALVAGVQNIGLSKLNWTKKLRQFQERVLFLRQIDPTWPNLSDQKLTETLEDWLLPFLAGLTRLKQVLQVDLQVCLNNLLSQKQLSSINKQAPTHWKVPTGSIIPIDYSDPKKPVLAVRVQEMFGASVTPKIAGGKIPLTLHLLSPAHRPVQVTQDLVGFWAGSYAEVRKEMRGRYPKHPWPEDPANATPTRRVKPRK